MEQLLKNLGSIESIGLGGEDPAPSEDGSSADLPLEAPSSDSVLARDVEDVISEAIESSIGDEEEDTKETVEAKVSRCRERQVRLENRFKNLQQRINALRVYKIGQHAAEQMQTAVSLCEKRGGIRSRPEPPASDNGVKPESSKEGETKIRRAKVRKNSRTKADETLGQLHGMLRHLQRFGDAEATESSSGGESADEEEKFSVGATNYAPINERAKYRWLKKRCEYASQWGWLQCQISDLEFRIRQQTELYKAFREAKGPVTLGEGLVAASPLKAGKYVGSTQGPDGIKRRPVEFDYNSEDNSEDDSTMTCSRVRPVKRVKRRVLIDTYGLHHTNIRASKPSSLTCSCLHPAEWCVLCLGRRNHKQTMDIHTQSRSECVALLDHSYHAVLSSKQEIPLNLALNESIANRRWVNLPQMSRSSSIPTHLSKLSNINDREKAETERIERGVNKRKHIRRRNGEDRPRKRERLDSNKQGVKSRPTTPEMSTNTVVKEIREIKEAKEIARIRDTSTLQEQMRKKRKINYDIDHIVLPYGMAASTRVPKPKYKEIQTPSWREVDKPYPWPPPGSTRKTVTKKPEPPKPSPDDSDFEDISDFTMAILHAKAEVEERARWATPLGRVHGGQRQRPNRARRVDSCMTEASSGANTPDPLSPGLIDKVEDIVVQTRPSSPLQDDNGPHLPVFTSAAPAVSAPGSSAGQAATTPGPSAGQIATTPGPSAGQSATTPGPSAGQPATPASVRNRRRTSSQTKSRDRNLSEASQHSQESSRSTSPWTEVDEIQQPYEPRQFPLTDEEMKELELEDSCMRPPPPPQQEIQSTATSRTTSRSSSVCEDMTEDPDWDEDEDEEEEEEIEDPDPEYMPRVNKNDE